MVVCLTGFAGTNNHPWASIRDTEEHYSASLLKVAAMYAAFDLRAKANQLATEISFGGPAGWLTLEPALRAQFDVIEITAHTPPLIASSSELGAADKVRRPDYRAMLDVTNGPTWAVDFSAAQKLAFEDMIVQQNNPGATTTTTGLDTLTSTGKSRTMASSPTVPGCGSLGTTRATGLPLA
jgi:hypothetical protein